MGVIHKLKPEVKNWILEKKTTNFELSCRQLVTLIEKEFKLKISKSTVSSLFKEVGLSMPVGRRGKEKKPEKEAKKTTVEKTLKEAISRALTPWKEEAETSLAPAQAESPLETQCTGAILIKAVDALLGGSFYISEVIKKHLSQGNAELRTLIESLIFAETFGLFEEEANKDLTALWSLVGKKITLDKITSFLNELQKNKNIAIDILQVLLTKLQEVRCIKVNPEGAIPLYLDAQFHTVWLRPHIPYYFNNSIYSVKSQLDKCLLANLPLVLFMAPGYDLPTPEFFNLLLVRESQEKRITGFGLCDNNSKELELMPLEQTKPLSVIFGLWPWQFMEHRQIKKIGQFQPFRFTAQNKDYYLAEAELELFQPIAKQSVTLRGLALKKNLSEDTRLFILSNLAPEMAKPELIANTYLNHWPNLLEAFQDLGRKIELFNATENPRAYFLPTGHLNLNADGYSADIKKLFRDYLLTLESYFRWHFFPLGCTEKDFQIIKEKLYNLNVAIKEQADYAQITFQVPEGFQFLKELAYILSRLNERTTETREGKKPWLSQS